MNINVKYKIIPDLKLIVECYSGETDLNILIEQRKILINDKEYYPNYNAIADFRDTYLSLNDWDVKRFIDFLSLHPITQGNRHVGILTDTPNQVAVSTLYAINLSGLPMKVEIFSTLEETAKWIGLFNQVKFINEIITKLKKKTA